jgi:ceramide glucosyltransferase
MPVDAARLAAWVAGTLATAGVAYNAFALTRVRAFRRSEHPRAERATPGMTILKPLFGEEPQLFENLSSFCDQAYPQFQVIFGAADECDPALEVARAVKDRFPDRDIEIVAGNAKPAANPKIGNLLGLVERARHPLIVIADSDIRVGVDYLAAIASCFDDPRTGAATCLYGGVPFGGFAATLGAMYVNDQFAPSVTVANAIEPLTYCFGATMAFRADVLEHIGGLESVAQHLADDYLLGKLVTDAGYRVTLAPYAVQTTVSDASVAALWRHEVRWARTVYGQRAVGYAGSILTYGLPFAAACAALARTPPAFGLLSVSAALRTWLHYMAREAFAPQTRATPWLIPLRDLFGIAVWASAFFGNRVYWRNSGYRLGTGGRMAAGPKEM